MKFKLILIGGWIALALNGCHHRHPEGEAEHAHEVTGASEEEHSHEELKLQFTAYSDHFELFAEADPFEVGKAANLLSHLTELPSFIALEAGKVTVSLVVNGKTTAQTLEQPTRKGIYSFTIQPESVGKGSLTYQISTEKGEFRIVVPEVTVFASHDEAHHAVEEAEVSMTNTARFTKEQSWKTDFATELPRLEPFGAVIKTTARIEAPQGGESVVVAKTSGVVRFPSANLLEGMSVGNGQTLFSIQSNDFADNNTAVRFAEAKSRFEEARTELERTKELAKDQIVAEKELLAAETRFVNAKAVYDNLNNHFTPTGQSGKSPFKGFVKRLFVANGEYVEAGQPVVTVAQDNSLMLTAHLPQRYASVAGAIRSANLQLPGDPHIYTIEELNGKILSYGKAASSDNYLIPVHLQIDNKGNFVAGGFAGLFLKTMTNNQALTIPTSSLLEEQGNYFVFVQANPELFEKREVVLGSGDGVRTEIVKGISDQERIVTKGAMLIKLSQSSGALDAHAGHVH